MSRLIDADALIFPGISVDARISEVIKNAPTVNAVPVMQGQWVGQRDIDCMLEGINADSCSVCGYSVIIADQQHYKRSNYCPNCGAKMEVL